MATIKKEKLLSPIEKPTFEEVVPKYKSSRTPKPRNFLPPKFLSTRMAKLFLLFSETRNSGTFIGVASKDCQTCTEAKRPLSQRGTFMRFGFGSPFIINGKRALLDRGDFCVFCLGRTGISVFTPHEGQCSH